MGEFFYRAWDPQGRRIEGTVNAPTMRAATEQLSAQEIEVVSLEAMEVSPRRFEPSEPKPPPPPRDIDVKISSQPGGWVLVLIGGIFTGVASILVIIGLALLASGNNEGLFLAGIPSIHLIVGSALLYFGLRNRARRRRIFRNGEVAMATIEGVGYNRSVRVNGRNPYELVWAFDVDGHRYHDKHSSFDETVLDFVPGDRIWVLYNPDDPEESAEWPQLGT